MPRKTTPTTMGNTDTSTTEQLPDGKAMVLTTDGIGDQPPTASAEPVDYSDEFTGAIKALHPASSGDTGLVDTAPADEAPATGCQLAPDCAQAGRAPWKFHTDKDGQRTTATEANGAFWNRACPADGCNVRVFLA